MSPESFAVLFGPLIVAFVVFLILRDVTLWYFKINKVVEELQTMNKYLKSINESLLPEQSAPPPVASPAASRNLIHGIQPLPPKR